MLAIDNKAGYFQRRLIPIVSRIMRSYLLSEGKIGQKALSKRLYSLAKSADIVSELKSIYPKALITHYEGNIALMTLGQYGTKSTFSANTPRL